MSQSRIVLNNFQRTEILTISPEAEISLLVRQMSEVYGFSAEYFVSIDEFQEAESAHLSPSMILISLVSMATPQARFEALEAIRKIHPRAPLVAVVNDANLAEASLLKNSGVGYVLSQSEVLNTSKFFYLASLLLHGSFFPVAVADLFPSTEVGFNAYHKLTLNQKFVPVVFEGFVFSDKKFRRLENFQQIYVHRKDLDSYRKYIETYNDRSGRALKKRCRANLMSLMGVFSELVLLLTLDSEKGSRETLNKKFAQFLEICNSLEDHIKDCPDVWEVLVSSLDFQFCRYERGPMILAYAVLLNIRMGATSLSATVLTALIADLGILDLSHDVYCTLLQTGPASLSPEQLVAYKNHPLRSQERVLERGLAAVTPEILRAVSSTHEQYDGQGFPHQIPRDQIPVEAQLILFCEKLDQRLRFSTEVPDGNYEGLHRRLLGEEKASLQCFSPDFLEKIEGELLRAVA